MPYTLSNLCVDISNTKAHKKQPISGLENQFGKERQASPWQPMVNRLESNDFANPQEVFDALVHCAEAGAPPSLLVLMVEKAGKDFNYGSVLSRMGVSKYFSKYAAQMVGALKASGASFFARTDDYDFSGCAMHNLAQYYPEAAKTLISEMLAGTFSYTQAELFYTIYAATKYRFPVELVLQLVEKAEVDNDKPEQTFDKHFESVSGRMAGYITNDDGKQEGVRECRTTLLHVFDYEHNDKLVPLVEALLAKGAKPFQSNYNNHGSGCAFNVLAHKFKQKGLHKDVLIAVLNHMARNAGGANNLYSASTYLYVDKVPGDQMYDVMTDVDPYHYALAHYQYLYKKLKFKEGEKGFVRPVFQHAGLMMLVAYLAYKYGDLKNKKSGSEYTIWESKVKDVVGLVKLMTDATPTPDKKKQKKQTRKLSGWRSNRYGVLREAFVEHVLSNQNNYQKHLAQLKTFYQTTFSDDSWDVQVIAKFKELGLGKLLGVDKPEAAADTADANTNTNANANTDAEAGSSVTTAPSIVLAPVVVAVTTSRSTTTTNNDNGAASSSTAPPATTTGHVSVKERVAKYQFN